MLATQETPGYPEKLEEEGCWHEDNYAQICYINTDDEEPEIDKKFWKLIATSEPMTFGTRAMKV